MVAARGLLSTANPRPPYALGLPNLVGISFEERDLLRRYGDSYRRYQQRVPKLIPGWRARPEPAVPTAKSALESTQH